MRVPSWRFWLPLSLQIFLVLAIPAEAVYTRIFGRTVVLQTIPVDPYDFLRGYSQILRYDISSLATLEKLEGWETVANAAKFYVILEAPDQSTQPPTPWKPIAVQKDLPGQLPPDQIALQGQNNYQGINYGLEKYYIPEAEIREINAEIATRQRQEPESLVVEIKVDSRGKATLISFWLGNERYEF